MNTAFAPPPASAPNPGGHVAISTANRPQPSMSQPFGGSPQFTPAAGDDGTAPGEQTLTPRPGPPQGPPQWPSFPGMQQQAPQQQPQQPQFQPQFQPAQPQFQPAPQQQFFAPPAQQQVPQPQFQRPMQQPMQQLQPPPQPQFQPAPPSPSVMQPDPGVAAGTPFSFNDGMQLAGPVGGTGGFAGQASTQQPPGGAASSALQQPPGGQTQQQPQFQAPPPANLPATAIRDNLIRQGLAVGQYQSDEELLEDLGSSIGEINQLRQMARYGQQYLAQQQPIPGQQVAPPQAAPAQQPQQPERPPPPEWRPEWSSLVRQNPQTGLFEAVDPVGVNPQIVERANQYAAWRRERSEALLRDPIGTLRQEGLDQILTQTREELKKELREQALQEQREAASRDRVEKFVELNKAVFYQLDQNGQPVVNPITRQPALTPRGVAAQQFATEYRQQFQQYYGMDPDPSQVIDMITLRMQAAEASGAFGQQPPYQQPGYGGYQQQPYQPQQQPSNQALKDQVIQRAIAMNGAQHQPNQMGTIAAAAAAAELPQNSRNADFRDLLVEAGKRRGLLHPSA